MKLELLLEDYPEGFPNVEREIWSEWYLDTKNCVIARCLRRNGIPFKAVGAGRISVVGDGGKWVTGYTMEGSEPIMYEKGKSISKGNKEYIELKSTKNGKEKDATRV